MVNYRHGAIVELILKDFGIHKELKENFDPCLNLYIAPNGSGKSTIVNGLCMALGGKAAYLGRVKNLKDFIRYGCDRSTITVELHNENGQNFRITRELLKNNNSIFKLNGKTVPQWKIDELVAELNIKVNNLIQFLPQDKVSQFASMGQKKLLSQTEQTVGGEAMVQNHKKLIDMSGHKKGQNTKINDLRVKLTEDEDRLKRLEPLLKTLEEKRQNEGRLTLLEKKKVMVAYAQFKEQLDEANRKYKAKEQVLEVAKEQLLPLQSELKKAARLCTVCEQKIREKTASIRDKQRQCDTQLSSMDDVNEQIRSSNIKYESVQKQEEKRLKAIRELKWQVDALRGEIQAATDVDVATKLEAVTKQIEDLMEKRATVQLEATSAETDLNAAVAQFQGYAAQLRRLRSERDRKEQKLHQFCGDAQQALQWFRQNKHLFKKRIEEPMMLNMSTTDPKYAKFIENTIGRADLTAFVCEDKKDQDILIAELRDKLDLRVPVVYVGDHRLNTRPRIPISQLRQYGFETYLLDCIIAPELVTRFLCGKYSQNVPIGSARVDDMIQQISEERPELRRYFSDKKGWISGRSAYSGDQWVRNFPIRPAQIFSGCNAEEMEKLEDLSKRAEKTQHEKRKALADTQGQMTKIETELNRLRPEQKKLRQHDGLLKKKQYDLNRKLAQCQQREKQQIDVEAAKRVRDEEVLALNKRKATTLMRHSTLTNELASHIAVKLFTKLQLKCSREKVEDLQREVTGGKKRVDELQLELSRDMDELKTIMAEYKRLKAETNRLLREAEDADMFGRALAGLPEDIDVIEAQIVALRAQLEMSEADNNVQQEHAQLKRKIEISSAELRDMEVAMEGQETEIVHLHNRWLPPLEKLIEKLNTRFEALMSGMGYAGSVTLKTPNSLDDYDAYGISIMVTYHPKDKMRELCPEEQSGGEKSLATVLYIMALQQETACPFRVLDEINQGMDYINESKLFSRLKDEASNEASPQYIMFSPKFLKGLPLDGSVRVCLLLRGDMRSDNKKTVPDDKDWDIEKFISIASHIPL